LKGVIEYSLCLFFTKLINYTFLYWLPRYIKESGRFLIAARHLFLVNESLTSGLGLSDKDSGDLSTLFDVGGIFGGILAGVLSDLTGMSAVTCGMASILSIPMASYSKLSLLKPIINEPISLFSYSSTKSMGPAVSQPIWAFCLWSVSWSTGPTL
jgi:OPA family glycerol-3-phosphate transporter-like MFS transporter 1/2